MPDTLTTETTTTPRVVHLSPRALHTLRSALERHAGRQAAVVLQEAGFADGETRYRAFLDHLRAQYGVEQPEDLDIAFLGEALSGCLREAGWGEVTIERLGTTVFAIDSEDWAEASSGAQYPSCHFSTGSLADLFTRIGGSQAAVMEVECRSKGDARCRFLVGSPGTLTTVYERMAAGLTYQQSLGL